ncbi:hypothetical protein [Streptomyces thermolilacinus]|nr:hypothetical protein [Streptomyces thermolilacinus]
MIDEYVSAIRVAGHDVPMVGAEPLPVAWLAAPPSCRPAATASGR